MLYLVWISHNVLSLLGIYLASR